VIVAVLLTLVRLFDIGWCRTDPVVKVGGKVGRLVLFTREDAKRAAVAALVRVGAPAGEAVQVARSEIFGARPTVEEYEADEVELTVRVDFPQTYPVRAVFEPAGSHALPFLYGEGESGEEIHLLELG
jgi:hypothetical protein